MDVLLVAVRNVSRGECVSHAGMAAAGWGCFGPRAALGNDEDRDEPLTLHDCLAADVDDPATAAARRLDWTSMFDSLDRTKKAILIAMAEGRELTLLVSRLKRSRTTLHYDKVKLGRLIQTCLGQDVLIEAQTRPGWTNTLDAIRERLACRSERRAG